MSDRDNRALSIILESAGAYISREAGRNTLITPTRVMLSSDRKDATIFVSVFPDGEEKQALSFLIRHKDMFRNELKKTRLMRLPFIHFEIDYGEKNRQHLEEISKDLDIEPEV
ncbi:MAG: Ribosome-binding factor [Parcubacteria group bacterium]|nr:Ribosome-binding factor [Parcubacteria group bacterium]